jgi:hypothetical protein
MKAKEGRDYLELNDCLVKLDKDIVYIYSAPNCYRLSIPEYQKLVFFVDKKIQEQKDSK